MLRPGAWAGQAGFEAKGQAPYAAVAFPDLVERSDAWQGEAAMLDLGPLKAPSDRQRIHDLWERLLRKQEEK